MFDLSVSSVPRPCLYVLGDNPQVQGIIIEIPKGGSDKFGVSNPQGAKGRSIFSQALSSTDTTLRTPDVYFQLEMRNKTMLWV